MKLGVGEKVPAAECSCLEPDTLNLFAQELEQKRFERLNFDFCPNFPQHSHVANSTLPRGAFSFLSGLGTETQQDENNQRQNKIIVLYS